MKADIRDKVLSSADNGVITSAMITKMGLHRSVLTGLVDSGELVRCSRGIYMLSDAWQDDYKLLQERYSQGIISHQTALYLHGYSEQVPLSFHMTFPTNYNSPSLNSENVTVTRVIPKNYSLGITEVETPYGNKVRAYDLERTLCDIVRGSGENIQIIQFAMKKYASDRNHDINRLMAYAKQLRVEPKIQRYMEVLL